MRGKLFLLLFILNLCLGFTLSAQNKKDCIYIHGNQSPVNDLFYLFDQIDKITFSEDAMNLHLKNPNTTETLNFSDFSLITFDEYLMVGIETQTSHKGIDVRYNNFDYTVAVSSSAPIVSLQVYSLQGKLIVAMSPQALSAIVSLADYPSGIYVMRASTGESVITQKIVKL